MFKNDRLHLLLFGLAHVMVLLPLFNTIYHMPHSSTPLYLDYASKIMGGDLPYRDFLPEYPPLSLIFFFVPRLFTSTLSAYAGAFQIEVLIFDLLGLFLIYRIAKITDRSPWKMMAVYSAAVLAIGPIIVESYDIFPAILTLLSLYFFITGRYKTAWVILALGFMTKLYPAVIAPVYIFYFLRARQFKHIWAGIGVFAATCLIIALPFLITNPGGLLNILTLHGSRPLQIESTYSSVLLIIDGLANTNPQVVFSFGSDNIVGLLPDTLASIAMFLMVFLLLPSYWLIYCRMKTQKSLLPEMGVYTLLVISILLIASKILSPQYLVWLVPLVPLVSGKKGYVITSIFLVLGALTYYIYPLYYIELNNAKAPVVVVLLVRNMLLICLTIFTAVFIYRSKTSNNTLQQ